jgi:hypothetical protein
MECSVKLGVHARDITASQSVRRSASEQKGEVFKVQVERLELRWNGGAGDRLMQCRKRQGELHVDVK